MKKVLPYVFGAAVFMGSATMLTVTLNGSPSKAQPTQVSNALKAASDDEDPFAPYDVSDLKAVWIPSESGMKISFKAPTKASRTDYVTWDDEIVDLTEIEKIEVGIDNGYYTEMTLLHTFTAPQPGEDLSYIEASLERGKRYSFKVMVYANGVTSYGTSTSDILAGSLPDKATDVSVSTVKGQMPVTVTFTAPTKYKDLDENLTSLTKAELQTVAGWYDDPELIAELSPIEPGKTYEIIVNKPEITGAKEWRLFIYNEDGASDYVNVPVYIGIDTPGSVNNLKAVEQENGDVLLSWDVPTVGAHNGYFEADGLRYVVKKKVGYSSEVVAENITDTHYTYNASEITEPQLLTFSVTAVSAAGDGEQSDYVSLVAGPALSLPFAETFDKKVDDYSYGEDFLWTKSTDCNSSYPPEWRVDAYKYAGNEQIKPEGGEGAFAYVSTYESTPISDFRLTSSKINVEGEAAVQLGYSFYATAEDSGEASIRSEISFDNGKSFKPVKTNVIKDAETKGWNKVVEVVEVPTGSKYAMIRLVGRNDKKALPIAVDNVTLKSAEAPQIIYPSSVSDFTATYNKAEKFIALSMKAPLNSHASLGDVNNEPLQSISCIKIARQIGYGNDYVTLHTFDNPTPGETLTWNDTDLSEFGEYSYRALVYVGDRSDYGNYPDHTITVGQIPLDVTNLNISTTRGSAPVLVTFLAPAKDIEGDDLESLKGVTVTRYNNDTFVWDEVEILSDVVPGNEYTVKDNNVISGKVYEYRVVANGTAGNAYGVSGSVYVGVDEPRQPTDVVAKLGEDGKVSVSWTAPTSGINNGYIDAEHLTYIVLRGNGYSDYNASQLVAGLTETSYVDDTEFGEEEIVKYFVKAVSTNYAGASGISNTLLVGKPSELPFVENFDKQVGDYIEAEHSSWQLDGSEGTSNWAFAEMAYLINEGQVIPVNGGKGLAYAYYGPYSDALRDDYMTSGNINVADCDKLFVSFYLYAVPGYNHWLNVDVSFDGGEFRNKASYVYTDFDEAGWKFVSIPVEKPADAKKMQVQFHAHKDSYSCSVAIDNIKVDSKESSIDASHIGHGILVAAMQGAIIVKGAEADADVMVTDLQGHVIYTGKGDCELNVAAGSYVVRVAKTSVKLLVR